MAVSWTLMLRKHHGILIESEICKSIFKAIHQPTQQIICIKSLPLLSSSSLNEAYLLRTILSHDDNQSTHSNILPLLSIKYLPSSSINNSIYFIFDYASNRDLATHGLLYGGTEKQLTHGQIQTYLHQLLSALAYCHDRLVYHCAVELKHLLIMRTGQLKLSNFEYAKHAAWPTMRIALSDLSCFSQAPPELLLGDRTLHGGSLDIWSVGCVFAQLCSSTQTEPLFRGSYQIELLFCIFSMMGTPTGEIWPSYHKYAYFNAEFPRWPRRNDHLYELTKLIGAQGLDLVKGLLTYDPNQRLSARTALQHPYFK